MVLVLTLLQWEIVIYVRGFCVKCLLCLSELEFGLHILVRIPSTKGIEQWIVSRGQTGHLPLLLQCVSARLDRSQVGLFCIVSLIGSTPTYAFMACRSTTVLCEYFRLLMSPAVLQADSWSGTRRGMLTLSDQHVLVAGTLGQRIFPVVILER